MFDFQQKSHHSVWFSTESNTLFTQCQTSFFAIVFYLLLLSYFADSLLPSLILKHNASLIYAFMNKNWYLKFCSIGNFAFNFWLVWRLNEYHMKHNEVGTRSKIEQCRENNTCIWDKLYWPVSYFILLPPLVPSYLFLETELPNLGCKNPHNH